MKSGRFMAWSSRHFSSRHLCDADIYPPRKGKRHMADDNDKRNKRPGSRPAGARPFVKTRLAASRVRRQAARFWRQEAIRKKADDAAAASGSLSATSSRAATASRAASERRLEAVRKRAERDERDGGRTSGPDLREARTPGRRAQSHSSKPGLDAIGRRRRRAFGRHGGRCAARRTGRSSAAPDQRAGKPFDARTGGALGSRPGFDRKPRVEGQA